VAEAVANCAREATLDDQEAGVLETLPAHARALAAKLLHCEPAEIALVGPTSLALSLVASGLRLRKGHNALVCFEDYPSNVYPWMAMSERGVQVRFLNTRRPGMIRAVDVLGQVDEETKVVALASCHFVSGWRIEVDAIGKALHDRGILFCVDGIQTLGAFPTSAQHVDFLAADAHKWLLGPCGAGVLYVRRSVQDRINPPIYGWNNVSCPNFVAQEQLSLRTGSQKYEAGTHNLLGIVGLVAAMELIVELGVGNIAAELLRKRALLIPALQAKGCTVLQGDAPPEAASGIVSFQRPGRDLPALHQKLLDAGVITSLRADRAGQQYIRLSPHCYTTDAELQRALDLI
jgi:selenocysteine lyase/cysteine desulfurase